MTSPNPDTSSSSGQRLARSATISATATLTSRILGLARDLFAEGAMSSALVPSFARQLTLHGKGRAWQLGHNVLTVLLLLTGILACLGIVFADRLVALIAPDFAAVPGKMPLTVTMTRVMLPF